MSYPPDKLDERSAKLTKLEVAHLLRITRAARDQVTEKSLLLQERDLSIGNGLVREAILACENEIFLLTLIITKLWRMEIQPAPPKVVLKPSKHK